MSKRQSKASARTGLLVVHADIHAPGFEAFRAALRSLDGPVSEIMVTYNAQDATLDGVLMPLDLLEGSVFSGLHEQAHEWQADLPAQRLETGVTVAEHFTDPDEDIPSHPLWVSRMAPLIQTRRAVIETVTGAISRAEPAAMCIFGVPDQLAWTRDLCERAAELHGIALLPPTDFLPTDLAAAYKRHADAARADIAARNREFDAQVAARKAAAVARMEDRVLRTATRVVQMHERCNAVTQAVRASVGTLSDRPDNAAFAQDVLDRTDGPDELDLASVRSLDQLADMQTRYTSRYKALRALQADYVVMRDADRARARLRVSRTRADAYAAQIRARLSDLPDGESRSALEHRFETIMSEIADIWDVEAGTADTLAAVAQDALRATDALKAIDGELSELQRERRARKRLARTQGKVNDIRERSADYLAGLRERAAELRPSPARASVIAELDAALEALPSTSEPGKDAAALDAELAQWQSRYKALRVHETGLAALRASELDRTRATKRLRRISALRRQAVDRIDALEQRAGTLPESASRAAYMSRLSQARASLPAVPDVSDVSLAPDQLDALGAEWSRITDRTKDLRLGLDSLKADGRDRVMRRRLRKSITVSHARASETLRALIAGCADLEPGPERDALLADLEQTLSALPPPPSGSEDIASADTSMETEELELLADEWSVRLADLQDARDAYAELRTRKLAEANALRLQSVIAGTQARSLALLDRLRDRALALGPGNARDALLARIGSARDALPEAMPAAGDESGLALHDMAWRDAYAKLGDLAGDLRVQRERDRAAARADRQRARTASLRERTEAAIDRLRLRASTLSPSDGRVEILNDLDAVQANVAAFEPGATDGAGSEWEDTLGELDALQSRYDALRVQDRARRRASRAKTRAAAERQRATNRVGRLLELALNLPETVGGNGVRDALIADLVAERDSRAPIAGTPQRNMADGEAGKTLSARRARIDELEARLSALRSEARDQRQAEKLARRAATARERLARQLVALLDTAASLSSAAQRDRLAAELQAERAALESAQEPEDEAAEMDRLQGRLEALRADHADLLEQERNRRQQLKAETRAIAERDRVVGRLLRMEEIAQGLPQGEARDALIASLVAERASVDVLPTSDIVTDGADGLRSRADALQARLDGLRDAERARRRHRKLTDRARSERERAVARLSRLLDVAQTLAEGEARNALIADLGAELDRVGAIRAHAIAEAGLSGIRERTDALQDRLDMLRDAARAQRKARKRAKRMAAQQHTILDRLGRLIEVAEDLPVDEDSARLAADIVAERQRIAQTDVALSDADALSGFQTSADALQARLDALRDAQRERRKRRKDRQKAANDRERLANRLDRMVEQVSDMPGGATRNALLEALRAEQNTVARLGHGELGEPRNRDALARSQDWTQTLQREFNALRDAQRGRRQVEKQRNRARAELEQDHRRLAKTEQRVAQVENAETRGALLRAVGEERAALKRDESDVADAQVGSLADLRDARRSRLAMLEARLGEARAADADVRKACRQLRGSAAYMRAQIEALSEYFHTRREAIAAGPESSEVLALLETHVWKALPDVSSADDPESLLAHDGELRQRLQRIRAELGHHPALPAEDHHRVLHGQRVASLFARIRERRGATLDYLDMLRERAEAASDTPARAECLDALDALEESMPPSRIDGADSTEELRTQLELWTEQFRSVKAMRDTIKALPKPAAEPRRRKAGSGTDRPVRGRAASKSPPAPRRDVAEARAAAIAIVQRGRADRAALADVVPEPDVSAGVATKVLSWLRRRVGGRAAMDADTPEHGENHSPPSRQQRIARARAVEAARRIAAARRALDRVEAA